MDRVTEKTILKQYVTIKQRLEYGDRTYLIFTNKSQICQLFIHFTFFDSIFFVLLTEHCWFMLIRTVEAALNDSSFPLSGLNYLFYHDFEAKSQFFSIF